MNSGALFNLQGIPALEIWSKQDLARLWQHLHNGNGRFEYVMGFWDKATGAKRYVRAKSKPVDRAIPWALATAQGRKTPITGLAFVPYSTNAQQMSRWGAFDFDAHDGDTGRARRFAFDAFRFLLNCEFAVILESSGSGGWHVWAISRDFKPVAGWIRLLKGVARDIGAPIEGGICEIFPPDTLSRGFGKGLRAPGSWNPGTNSFSEIWWHNTEALIAELPACLSGKSVRIGEVSPLASDASPIEKDTSLSPFSFSVMGSVIGGVEHLRIENTATRREKLQALVGTAFYQVSRSVAEHLARAQFSEKTVQTNADEGEHLADFASLWDGLENQWIETHLSEERRLLSQLATDAECAAFRIVQNFARKARTDGNSDFPVARDNLAARIGLTGRGAGLLRRKFVRLRIKQTAEYRANVAAARYRWLLGGGPSEPHHP